MTMFPNRRQVDDLRIKYPAGTRVRLLVMDDPQAPPAGSLGTVRDVDDAGQIRVRWDAGGSLSLVPGVDLFKIVEEDEGAGA